MKNLFENESVDEVIERIDGLAIADRQIHGGIVIVAEAEGDCQIRLHMPFVLGEEAERLHDHVRIGISGQGDGQRTRRRRGLARSHH